MTATFINIAAWAASGVFALLLLSDFIKTERQAKRDAEEREHE